MAQFVQQQALCGYSLSVQEKEKYQFGEFGGWENQ